MFNAILNELYKAQQYEIAISENEFVDTANMMEPMQYKLNEDNKLIIAADDLVLFCSRMTYNDFIKTLNGSKS